MSHTTLRLSVIACLSALLAGCAVEADFPVAGAPPHISPAECHERLSALGVGHSLDMSLSDVPTPVRLFDAGPGVALVYDDPRGSEAAGTLNTSCAVAIGLGQVVANLRAQGRDVSVIYHVGSYYPRNIAGTNTPSAHSYGLALDIRGVRIDGVREDLPRAYGSERLAALERELYARFDLVLGPGFDQNHADHFHVEVTYGTQAIDPAGFEVVQRAGDDALYALEDGLLHRIYSLDSYVAMGGPAVRTLAVSDFAALPHARSIDGSDEPLLKSPTSPDVFVLRDGALWLLDDEAAYYACTGMTEFASVFEHATPALLSQWRFAGTLHRDDCSEAPSSPTPPAPPAPADQDGDGIADADDMLRHAGGTELCLRRDAFDPSEVGPFSVVGDGLGSWEFDPSHLAAEAGDWLCFSFPTGSYRITWRTQTSWAQYGAFCATHRDSFCTRDSSGSYGIGFSSSAGTLHPILGDE